MKFKISKKYIDEHTIIQKKTELELPANTITYICGCNGYGKSTLLQQLKDNVISLYAEDITDLYNNPLYRLLKKKNDNTSHIYYLDYNVHSKFGTGENDFFMSDFYDFTSSNGEGLSRKLIDALRLFKRWLTETKDIQNRKFFFFLDDCDAGTSIDVIFEIKNLLKLISTECEDSNVEYYIVLPVNSYEFVRDSDAYCIDACNFKIKHFKSYNQYKQFVWKTRTYKDKRSQSNEVS